MDKLKKPLNIGFGLPEPRKRIMRHAVKGDASGFPSLLNSWEHFMSLFTVLLASTSDLYRHILAHCPYHQTKISTSAGLLNATTQDVNALFTVRKAIFKLTSRRLLRAYNRPAPHVQGCGQNIVMLEGRYKISWEYSALYLWNVNKKKKVGGFKLVVLFDKVEKKKMPPVFPFLPSFLFICIVICLVSWGNMSSQLQKSWCFVF